MSAEAVDHDRWLARRAAAFSVRNRRRKAAFIVDYIRREAIGSVLVVGTEDAVFPWSNIIERALMDSSAWVVATGLGPEIEMPTARAIADGRRLPFKAKSFDLVVSNAVIEHVGQEADQQAFVSEHHRVGRHFILTTPNLAFPVESHLRVAFRHWSARYRARHSEAFSRLMTGRQLKRLLPHETAVAGGSWWPTLIAVHSCSASRCEAI